jgi:hypothetical protein
MRTISQNRRIHLLSLATRNVVFPPSQERGLHPGDLALSELGKAAVVTVIHIVVDGIGSRFRSRIIGLDAPGACVSALRSITT